MFFVKRIPCAPDIHDEEHCKQENIVGNHARPCRNKSKAEHLCAHECAADSDEPHTDDIENKRLLCLADTLQ